MALDPEALSSIGRTVDDLVTTELRHRTPRAGIVKPLHDAARNQADGPLTMAAATSLHDTLTPDDTVLIATGAGDGRVHLPNGETDGPPGAAALARALSLGLGARPIILTEPHCVDAVRTSVRACGLNILDYDRLTQRATGTTIEPLDTDPTDPPETAAALLDEYDPCALIAIEKVGPNRAGVLHSANGTDVTAGRADLGPLFEQAADAGILTVGVGDNGNEIGFGVIEPAVQRIQPYGDPCQCPCEAGVACRVQTDHLVVANVSNWGAYGTAAILAILAETPVALHDPAAETRMLDHLALAGVNDGAHDRPMPGVDGTARNTQAGIVAILNDLVHLTLTDPPDRGY